MLVGNLKECVSIVMKWDITPKITQTQTEEWGF